MKVSAQSQFQKMTETPIPNLILSLGIPTTISMLVTSVYNMGDTYFVSTLGTSASGAIGVVFGLQAILQALGFMYGHGAGSIISRKLGQRDVQSAHRISSTAFFGSILTGILIAILGLIWLRPLMQLLGSTPTILPYAKQYGVYILLGAPFMLSSCVLNNILRYEGQAAWAMIGLTAGGLLNLLGDPLLIFVCHMGVSGAGLSTLISQSISFFILLAMFFLGKTQSKLSIRYVTKHASDVWLIVNTGMASLIRQGLNSVSTMLLNHQAAMYGDAAVAGMSIVNRVTFFVFAVGLGIGQGFQPVSAFNYGAGKYSRVKKGFYFTVFVGDIMLGVLGVLVIVFAPEIVRFFRNDPEVIRVSIFALRCQCLACMFQPYAVCSNMMFQSIGKAGRASFLSALRSGIFFIPLILILPQCFGILGVQISQSVSDVLTFIVSLPFSVSFLAKLPTDRLVTQGNKQS